jgi:hypothetical protein
MPPEASATPIYWPWPGDPASPSTIKGSYDHYMMRNLLNQERATLQGFRELIAELRDKRREELNVAAEDRRRYEEPQREDRQCFAEQQNQLVAMQQAILETIVRLAQDRNGNHGTD